jgi:hypothetical protein
MIQRKQTVYLFLAAILAIVCIVVDPIWLDTLQGLVAALSGYTIFQFKQRPRQAMFCLVAILFVLAWYIGLAVIKWQPQTLDALPMCEAILIFLARKGIIADEKLVRAADRIR